MGCRASSSGARRRALADGGGWAKVAFHIRTDPLIAARCQPVAILIFADANVYRRAKRALQFQAGVVQTGGLPPPPRQPWALA